MAACAALGGGTRHVDVRPQAQAARGAGPDLSREAVLGALIAALCAWLVWSLLYNGYLGGYWYWPLYLLTPDSWYERGGDAEAGARPSTSTRRLSWA
ncbi:hypothetical protein NKH77_37615 [Streptomyces sp. M19]